MRPGIVAFDYEVFELVVEDGCGLATNHQLRIARGVRESCSSTCSKWFL